AGGAISLNISPANHSAIGGNLVATSAAGGAGGTGSNSANVAGGAGGAGGAITIVLADAITGNVTLLGGNGGNGGNAGSAGSGGAGGAGGAISAAIGGDIGGTLTLTNGSPGGTGLAGGGGQGAVGAGGQVTANVGTGTHAITGGVSGSGTLNLMAGSSLISTYASDASLSVLRGPGSLVKAGSGVLTVGDSSAFTGVVTQASGTVGGFIINAGAMGGDWSSIAASAITYQNGSVSSLSGLTATTGGASSNLDLSASSNVSTIISGIGSLSVSNSSNLTLSSANTYTGNTSINSGSTITLGINNAIKSGNDLSVNAGGTLALDNNITSTLSVTGTGTVTLATGSILNASYDAGSHSLGSYSGTGTFNKTGVGDLTLTGASNSTGSTNVTDGRLILSGTSSIGTSLAPAATVSVSNGGTLVVGDDVSTGVNVFAPVNIADGVLKGRGTITGNVSMSGSLKPGNSIGTLNVNGDYTQVAGSAYQVEFDPTVAGLSDKIVVTGTATLQGGAVSAVKLPVATLSNWANRYTVLTANTINGTFASSAMDAVDPALRTHLMYGAQKVDLVVTSGIQSQAINRNQSAAGVAIERIIDSNNVSGSRFDEMYDMSAAQVQGILSKAAGALHSNAMSAGQDMRRAFNRATSDHLFQYQNQTLASEFSGVNPGSRNQALDSTAFEINADEAMVAKRTNAWLRGIGQWGEGTFDGNAAGYSQDMSGLVGGMDFRVSKRTSLGFDFGYATSRIDNDDAATADLASWQIGTYGRVDIDNVFIDGNLGFAKNSYDSQRSTHGGTATGQSNGTDVFGGIDVGYHYEMSQGYAIEPWVGLSVLRSQKDGFTETGAGLFNLEVGESTVTATDASAGFRAFRTIKRADFSYEPEFRLRLDHGFGINTSSTTASIGGQSFESLGVERGRDAAVAGIGLTVITADDLSLTIGYDFEGRRNFSSHSGIISLRKTF
ncbi:MAG: autotransporter domain-containing protein, partial [Magnetococcales bacterium]|nr:autotransporter domain-containing protein [Magnetococcales bacterium]